MARDGGLADPEPPGHLLARAQPLQAIQRFQDVNPDQAVISTVGS
ncbi:MAG: hypothetical protein ACKO5M_02890 [Vulcanococcus sp.]